MNSEYPTRLLCRVLSVSPSGYYDWQRRQTHPSVRTVANAQLLVLIEQIHQASRRTYGSPRIQHALRQRGCCHSRNRIARLMRQKNLFGRRQRRFRVQTTDSDHAEPVAPNLLAQWPAPQAVNQIWLADITYIPTDEGWLYLAGILDRFSRKVVGWAMAESLDTQLVLASWQMALAQRRPASPLLFHSDRGVQYASAQFRGALRQANALCSMSRKGNCYDNAVMESFWSTLKHELIYRCHFRTRAQARQALFEYIEVFYNRCRLHSSLHFLSPVDFENQNN